MPVVLHVPDHDPAPAVDRVLDGFAAARAATLVLSADSGLTGYDTRPTLDDEGWRTLRLTWTGSPRSPRNAGSPPCCTRTSERWSRTPTTCSRVLDGSDIALCLDTGHLLIGGTDPAELTRQVPERIAHTHMKDVDNRYARRVQSGELTYTEAVREGMYRPLGSGDVDVAAIVEHLEGRGYGGWYVLEQDTILRSDPSGEGPVADVRTSVEYLCGLFARPPSASDRPWSRPDRHPRRRADRRAVDRRPAHRPGNGWWPSPPATGRAPRRSQRGTASSGWSSRTPRCSPIPRSRSSTTRWPTRARAVEPRRGPRRPARAHRETVGQQRRRGPQVRDAATAAG